MHTKQQLSFLFLSQPQPAEKGPSNESQIKACSAHLCELRTRVENRDIFLLPRRTAPTRASPNPILIRKWPHWPCWQHWSNTAQPVCLQENALARQTDGLSLSLWGDFKGSKRVKGKETERGGSVRRVSMATVTSPEAHARPPHWEFCLRGGEGKQQVSGGQKEALCEMQVTETWLSERTIGKMKLFFFLPFFFFFFYSPLTAIAPIPLHLSVMGGCWNRSALRQHAINTGRLCGGDLYAPVSPVIFNWAITMRDRNVEEGEREEIQGACSPKHHFERMRVFFFF